MRTRLIGCTFFGFLVAALPTMTGCGNDCAEGTTESDGECVAETFTCGAGTTLSDGQCVASTTGCGAGTTLEGTVCVPNSEALCGAGTSYKDGQCVADDGGATCGEDTFAVDGECRPAAYFQVLHNVAASDVATVDVYVDGELEADELAFRNATPFFGVVAGVEHTIAITAADATDASAPLLEFTVSPTVGSTTAVVAAGDPQGDTDTDLRLLLVPTRRSAPSGTTSIALVHGATDRGGVQLSSGPYNMLSPSVLEFGDFTQTPLSLGRQTTAFDLFNATRSAYIGAYQTSSGNELPVVTRASTEAEGGTALVVVISGLAVDPPSGFEFGLFAVPADGGAFLPLDHAARVQFVRNSSDPTSADLYADDQLMVDDFLDRRATDFRAVVAEAEIDIALYENQAGAFGDPPTGEPYITFKETFESDTTSIVVQSGTLAADDFRFDVSPFAGRTASADNSQSQIAVFNGSVDAGSVDIEVDGNLLGDDVSYGEYGDYQDVTSEGHDLRVLTSDGNELGDGSRSSFNLNLSEAEGRAAIIVISGSATNLNVGDPESTFRALLIYDDGTVIELEYVALTLP